MDRGTTFRTWREAFRYRAYALAQRGWSQTAIADALGVTPSIVSRWLKRAQAHGQEALGGRPHPGRPPQLTRAHLTALRQLLQQGAPAHGFVGEIWTGARVAALVNRHFHVTMSERHGRRILHQLGWSRQTPARTAAQRDEAAITRWVSERWPRLKRRARRAHRTIVFVDESGVYLLPGVEKTWAPRGETPVVHEQLSKAHLSVISAVSPAGQMYYQYQRTAYTSATIINFLHALHTVIPGKLLVIWDGAPIHHSQEIQDFLKQGASDWLRLEQLPGYAPELNPDEGIWNYLKHVELKNVCTMTMALLEAAVMTALHRIGGQPDLIQAFFRHAGLA